MSARCRPVGGRQRLHTNIDTFFATMPAARKAGFDARGMTIEKLRCNYECKDFPCRKLQPLAEGAERYPHNLKVYNLATIRNRGIEAWAAEVGESRQLYFSGKFKIGAGPQRAEGK